MAAGHFKDILTAVADLDGHVLLLGCRNRNNTSIHSAQAAAFLAVEGIPRAQREFLRWLPKRPEDFDELDGPLIEAGAMRVGRIGDTEIRWMRARDLFSVVRRVYESRYRDADAARSTPRTFRTRHPLQQGTTPPSTIWGNCNGPAARGHDGSPSCPTAGTRRAAQAASSTVYGPSSLVALHPMRN